MKNVNYVSQVQNLMNSQYVHLFQIQTIAVGVIKFINVFEKYWNEWFFK